jgi:hypothetical protein
MAGLGTISSIEGTNSWIAHQRHGAARSLIQYGHTAEQKFNAETRADAIAR